MMSFTLSSVFALFLPVVVFAGGAYLFVMGYSGKKEPEEAKKGALSGPVSSSDPVRSLISGEDCVYSKTVAEFYCGGHEPWRQVFITEARAPLCIAGKPLDASRAVFDLSNPLLLQGHAGKKFRGILGSFGDFIDSTQPMALAKGVLDAAGIRPADEAAASVQLIDDRAISAILACRGGQELKRHISKPLRISEYVLAEGTRVSASWIGPPVQTGLPGEILITDAGDESAAAAARERAIMRMAVGGGLVLLSLVVSVIIMLS